MPRSIPLRFRTRENPTHLKPVLNLNDANTVLHYSTNTARKQNKKKQQAKVWLQLKVQERSLIEVDQL